MGKMRRFVRTGSFCCLFFILVGILFWLFHERYVIRLINRTQDRLFFSRKISPGDRFTFKYIHSVQKTPVYEIFTIDEEGNVILVETRVMSLGYGLPAPTRDDEYTIEEDFLVIRNLHRNVGKLMIRVNFVRRMEIDFGQQTFDLREYGRPGDLIEVSAARKSWIRGTMGRVQE